MIHIWTYHFGKHNMWLTTTSYGTWLTTDRHALTINP